MPTKTWVVGEEVLAADFNTFVQKQVVATFANSAARSAAIPSPTEGMVTWLDDVNSLEKYNGTAWVTVGVTATISGVAYLGNIMIQTGQTVAATNAAGLITTAFPIVFSAIPIVIVQNGDDSRAIVHPGNMYPNYFDAWARFNDANGTVIASGAVRYNWVAIGLR